MASTEKVKINVVAEQVGPGVPNKAKLAHILALFVSGVIALCVSSVLADGQSVIVLKPVKDLPRATNPALVSQGLDYRLDELLGPGYGVGLHHDQSGTIWNEAGSNSDVPTLKHLIEELGLPAVIAAVPSVISTDGLKHPVHFLSCTKLEQTGLAAMSFGFIAEIVAVVMILFHALALAGMLPAKLAKVLAVLVWLVLSVGFLIVCMLAEAIYVTEWTCDQVIIPTIRLSDHFNYNYGFGFAIIGYISSLLILNVTLVFTSTKDGEADQPKVGTKTGLFKVVIGVGSGLMAAIAISMIVLAPNDAFEDKAAPNIEAASGDESVNPCEAQKPYHATTGNRGGQPGDSYFSNTECFKDSVAQTLEQAGGNVTKGYVGGFDAKSRVPITQKYSDAGLCPVNVHWHLGAEHLSVGANGFDTHGSGPAGTGSHRMLAAAAAAATGDASATRPRASDPKAAVRQGFQCSHYKTMTAPQKVEYDWKFCEHMHVGETYEVHWPHSAAGACGTEWQMQSPFYDGVFCRDGIITIAPLNTFEKIGVQAQVFTIVNDEADEYVNMDLIKGMIVNKEKNQGTDMGIYTGSTTGTSRDNDVCSRYTPITWQVDRQCHKISASSFDNMCKQMLEQKDDMHSDIHPHGARELVAPHLTANNMKNRK